MCLLSLQANVKMSSGRHHTATDTFAESFHAIPASANDNDAVNSLTLDQGLEVHYFLMNHFIISVVSHSVDFCVESSDFAADGSRHLQ